MWVEKTRVVGNESKEPQTTKPANKLRIPATIPGDR